MLAIPRRIGAGTNRDLFAISPERPPNESINGERLGQTLTRWNFHAVLLVAWSHTNVAAKRSPVG